MFVDIGCPVGETLNSKPLVSQSTYGWLAGKGGMDPNSNSHMDLSKEEVSILVSIPSFPMSDS